jgi:hypothetical protein
MYANTLLSDYLHLISAIGPIVGSSTVVVRFLELHSYPSPRPNVMVVSPWVVPPESEIRCNDYIATSGVPELVEFPSLRIYS